MSCLELTIIERVQQTTRLTGQQAKVVLEAIIKIKQFEELLRSLEDEGASIWILQLNKKIEELVKMTIFWLQQEQAISIEGYF